MERITKAACPSTNHREYNVIYLAASKLFTRNGVDEGKFTEDNAMRAYESQDNQADRLALLQMYIKEQLQLIHKLGTGSPEKKVRQPKQHQHAHPNNLVDPREAWKCSLCQGNHKNEHGRIRRYYFNKTCEVFATFSARKKVGIPAKDEVLPLVQCREGRKVP